MSQTSAKSVSESYYLQGLRVSARLREQFALAAQYFDVMWPSREDAVEELDVKVNLTFRVRRFWLV